MNKFAAILYLIIISLSIQFSAYSQNGTISFNHISVKNGLSQNGVMVIFKDSKGYMWFGTRDGLNKYDGLSFDIYRNNTLDLNSISNNFITAIEEDKNGNLWIGTNNGLNCFNRKTGKFSVFKNEISQESSISNNSILSILCDSSGNLWVGTENGLNLLVNFMDKKFVKFFNLEPNPNSLSDSHIHALFEDSKKQLWVGTRYGGLNKMTRNTNEFIRFSHDPNNDESISSNHITVISEDKDNNIWIGTGDAGICVLKDNGEIFHKIFNIQDSNSLSNNRIRSLVFDDRGNLWIGTYNGLNYYDRIENKFEIFKNTPLYSKSISNNSIKSLLLDENGFLWAGTYFGGINILNPIIKQFIHHQPNPFNKGSLSYGIVGSLVEDKDGNVWIGTEGGGLNFFNYKSQSFSRIDEFHGQKLDIRTIKSLMIDRHDNLWIGTHLKGLFHLNFKTLKVKNFTHTKNILNSLSGPSVTALFEDSMGRIWIGSETGLDILYPSSLEINKVQLKENNNPNANSIRRIVSDSKNDIWVGTKDNGLFHYSDGKIKHFQHNVNNPQSLSHNSVYEIFEDSKKQLWIGTYGGGLNSIDLENETFEKFQTNDGLINNIVYNIQEDNQNNLWLSTPSGLSKFNLDSLTFKNYIPNNGLPIDEFNSSSSLKHTSGNLFFGGFNGLISFAPENIKDNQILPKIILTDLKLANKSVTPNDNTEILTSNINETKKIKFSHDQNIFTIEFNALNYSQIGQNHYAYMLDGLDPDWNYVGNKKFATYTNLDPGEYTFLVRAANNDEIWNEKAASLKIIKLPPYWKTNLAYVIYLLLVSLIFFIIRKYFLIKLHLENNLKLEKLEKIQLEDLTQLKLKFFTNISHDFRTPLTLIHGPLQELLRNFNNNEERGHLLLIKKNVNFMLRLINQLMDFRKLQTSKLSLQLSEEPLVPFVKEITYSFKELAVKHDIKYKFITRVPDKDILFDKDKIEKILYNLLSNAFKYTPDGGRIITEIYRKHAQNSDQFDYLEISIKNSGHGIDKADLENIFNRFFQNYNHIEHSQPSTGIGLSLAKSLIELHKGYIKVDSELEKETEFIIGIPLADIYSKMEKTNILETTQNAKDEFTVFPSKIQNNLTNDRRKFSILIVEDNSDLNSFLANSLSKDYIIYSAENGEIGVSIAQKYNPTIIISDIMMPNMSGIEMCKILKKSKNTQHIPIILLTARTASSIELDSYDIGALDFISKPFEMEILKSKISNLIESMASIKIHSHKEVLMKDSEININSAEDEFLVKLTEFVKNNISKSNLNVHNTGVELGMSRVHLYRKVKKITGKSPVEFIRNFRLSVAAELLGKDNYNVNEVSYKVGFQDVSYFRKCFKKKYGVCSTKFAERLLEEEINP